MKQLLTVTLFAIAVLASSISAGPNDPIVGEEFEALVDINDARLIELLSQRFPENEGYLVTGPLTASRGGGPYEDYYFGATRIICPSDAQFREASETFSRQASTSDLRWPIFELGNIILPRENPLYPWRAAQVEIDSSRYRDVVLLSAQHCRLTIWAGTKSRPFGDTIEKYSDSISVYLMHIDTGWMEAPAPKAVDYGLPDSLDFYAEPPDYVIEGYENYQNFLHAHDTIRLDFANGFTEFVPSDSLWEAMKENAPRAAFPNKEWPMLQHEYKKFFDRGGDVRVMQTLTAEGFDTLQTGEYFFAVSVAGKVRFGRELMREEVKQIEAETGKKVPRANHAFLFPGEPVLTAGAFFIEENDDGPYLTHITAQSGHYFYSNVSSTIREDIAERSDYYLTTLGHFFVVLDSLGIPHDNVVISKL